MRTVAWILGSLALHSALLLGLIAERGAAQTPDRRPAQAAWHSEPASAEPALATAFEEVLVDVAPDDAPPARPNVPDAPEAAKPLPPAKTPTAPVQAQPKAQPKAPSPPVAPAAPARAPAKSEGEDWLGIESEQSDAPPSDEGAAAAAPAPPRDLLVERLLRAEQEKAARRQERLTAAGGAAPPAALAPAQATPPPDPVVTSVPQDLADKFTRAVTEAEKHNSLWATHPLGEVGRVRVRLNLVEGKLGDPTFEGSPPALLRELVKKTLFLLRRGTFALPFASETDGAQWFELRVRLSQVNDVNRYAYERPTPTRPGRAFFVLPNGRLFEAFVDPNVAQ